jgi:hypothetical protein
VHLDPLAGDRHGNFTEIDLQLLAGSRFEAHCRHLGRPQLAAKRRDRPFHRAQ